MPDAVAGCHTSKTASSTAHHGVAERPARRVVQEKVGGEVDVEEILEDVLGNADRISGRVVGMELRHNE